MKQHNLIPLAEASTKFKLQPVAGFFFRRALSSVSKV
jgi:hypothetical protein